MLVAMAINCSDRISPVTHTDNDMSKFRSFQMNVENNYNQREAKPKHSTRDCSRVLNKLQAIARNSSDSITALFIPEIGRGNYFGIGFSTFL